MKLLTALLFTRVVAGLVTPRAQDPAPYIRPDGDLVEDEYIVILHEGHTIEDHFIRIGMNLEQSASMFYPIHTLGGYRARLSSHTIHELVRFDPGVKVVEHDAYGEPIIEYESGESHESTRPASNALQRRWEKTVHSGATWWSVMISAASKLSLPVAYQGDYWSLGDAGEGVNIYILDSGIRISHMDFWVSYLSDHTSRASNFQGMTFSKYVNDTMDDLHGHGTHVAGIAGGEWQGAAHKANLINVKVIAPDPAKKGPGKSSTNGGLAQALSDVTQEHMSNRNSKPKGWRGSVINMSLKTPKSDRLRDACAAAFQAGIPIAVSAGNANVLTDQAPCAYTGSTVCVAASNRNYEKAWFSNYGPNVFIIAPGENITAASNEKDNYEVTKSGTSMASPFVAGVMANFVSYEGIDNDVHKVWKRLQSNQLNGIITGFPTGSGQQTINAFVNNGISKATSRDPYAGIPHDELKTHKFAAVSDGSADDSIDTNVTDSNDTAANDNIIDSAGLTATLTEIKTAAQTTVPETAVTSGAVGFEGDNEYDDDFTTTTSATPTTSAVPSTTSGPAPSPTACHCNEDGCTSDPPGSDAGCCGDGTCGPNVTNN